MIQTRINTKEEINLIQFLLSGFSSACTEIEIFSIRKYFLAAQKVEKFLGPKNAYKFICI